MGSSQSTTTTSPLQSSENNNNNNENKTSHHHSKNQTTTFGALRDQFQHHQQNQQNRHKKHQNRYDFEQVEDYCDFENENDKNLTALERARKHRRYQNQNSNNNIKKIKPASSFVNALHPEEFIAPRSHKQPNTTSLTKKQQEKDQEKHELDQQEESNLHNNATKTFADEIYHLNPLMFSSSQQQQPFQYQRRFEGVTTTKNSSKNRHHHHKHKSSSNSTSRNTSRISSRRSSFKSSNSTNHRQQQQALPASDSTTNNNDLPQQHQNQTQKEQEENEKTNNTAKPPPLPLTTNEEEAPRYQVNEEFFNVLTHFSDPKSHSPSLPFSTSPFQFFGEGLGTNHLIEPSARRCGIRKSITQNQNDPSTSSFSFFSFDDFSPSKPNKKNFYVSELLHKFKNNNLADGTSSASFYASSSTYCRKCSLCGMCSSHSIICSKTLSPHHNNGRELFSSFCRIEPGPLLLENIISKNVPRQDTTKVSLSELHSQLLNFVLEIGVDSPIFSSSSSPKNEIDDAGYDENPLVLIKRANEIVSQLFESSGVTTLLLSFLNSLNWYFRGSSSSSFSSSSENNNIASSLLACDLQFDFATKSTFFKINWMPKIVVSSSPSSSTSHQEGTCCFENLFTVLELLFPDEQKMNSDDDDHDFENVVSSSWCPLLKRFSSLSNNNGHHQKHIINIEDVQSRIWFQKMKCEVASAIVSSTLQKLLFKKKCYNGYGNLLC